MEEPRLFNLIADVAAKVVSTFLRVRGHDHAFIGGYAALLLGGTRDVENVDVLIDADVSNMRSELLEWDSRFILSSTNKLVFTYENSNLHKTGVIVQLYQGGAGQQLKLPSITSAPILRVVRMPEAQIPIIHPSILVLTKIKRWMFIEDSARPASVAQAANDMQDIRAILFWLKVNHMRVNFGAYPEKPKEELLTGVRKLYAKDHTCSVLLDSAMEEETLSLIRD